MKQGKHSASVALNQAVNAFWTVIGFVPVFWFWSGERFMPWFYVFIVVSVLSLFIPARALQLSGQPRFYERLGVRWIRKFVQNGDLVNRFIRRSDPAYKVLKDRDAAVRYRSTVAMYERYHFLFLVYFLMVSGYAVVQHRCQIAVVILAATILYNICPLLLHQYNKARIMRVKDRRSGR